MWALSKMMPILEDDILSFEAFEISKVFIHEAETGTKFTYEDILTKASVINNSPKERYLICCSNNASLALITVSLLLSGKTIFLIDPKKISTNDAKFMGEKIGSVDLLITDIPKEKLGTIGGITEELVTPERYIEGLSEVKDKSNLTFRLSATLITFTSGSSGVPKGVIHEFKNLVLSGLALAEATSLKGGDVFYHNLPMTYMAGVLNQLVLPFVLGAKVIIGERFESKDALNFWNIPLLYGANIFWLTPTIISLLTRFDRDKTSIEKVKSSKIRIFSATAPLYLEVQSAFEQKYNQEIMESYGLSETLFVSVNPRKQGKLGPGVLLKGVESKINEDGELLIKTPWTFKGYLGAQEFDLPFFHSGDIGDIQDSYLIICDRKKDLIIKGGANLSPVAIENFLASLDCRDFAIVGEKDESMGERVVCFFVDDDLEEKTNQKSVNNQISSTLGAEYKIDRFKKVNEIYRNLSGKIDRKRLREFL